MKQITLTVPDKINSLVAVVTYDGIDGNMLLDTKSANGEKGWDLVFEDASNDRRKHDK